MVVTLAICVGGRGPMIDTSPASTEPFLVKLHHLAFPPNPPAGMSLWTLIAVGNDRRNGGHQVRDPILVRRHPTWSEGWLIVDGRHRTAASLMAGCESILAVEAAT